MGKLLFTYNRFLTNRPTTSMSETLILDVLVQDILSLGQVFEQNIRIIHPCVDTYFRVNQKSLRLVLRT